MKRVSLLIVLAATAQLLAACGTSCDCPRCPGATVVTPSSHTTVIEPND